jgi:hypothetical protein
MVLFCFSQAFAAQASSFTLRPGSALIGPVNDERHSIT